MSEIGRTESEESWHPERLRAFSCFDHLTDAQLEQVWACLDYDRLAPNCNIVEQGESGDSMFLLLSGRAVVAIEGFDQRDMILQFLRGPSYFGELSVIDSQPRSATVTTWDEVELLELHRPNFKRLLQINPNFGWEMLQRTAKSLRGTLVRLGENTFLNSEQRVVAIILWLTGDPWQGGGRSEPAGGWRTMEKHTQGQLGNMAHTSRETVTRTFVKLRELRAMRMRPGHVEIDTRIARTLLPSEDA